MKSKKAPKKKKQLHLKLAGVRVLLSALVAVAFVLPVLAKPQSSSNPASDETLIVRLAPHADREKVKDYLAKEAQVTSIKDLHVNREDYSIFLVQPPKGQGEETLKKIEGMMKTHSEIVSVSRDVAAHSPLLPKRAGSGHVKPSADGNK